jgi:hypothetical protein
MSTATKKKRELESNDTEGEGDVQKATKRAKTSKDDSEEDENLEIAAAEVDSEEDEDLEISLEVLSHMDKLFFEFDKRATRGELVDLHSHLMGMGSADFWVNRIMRVYLINKTHAETKTGKKKFEDVKYSVSDMWIASGLRFPNSVLDEDPSWKRAILESKMFDGLRYNMASEFNPIRVSPKNGSPYDDWEITNTGLMKLLEQNPRGPLRGMLRNWYEFLDVHGNAPSLADILQTCKLN